MVPPEKNITIASSQKFDHRFSLIHENMINRYRFYQISTHFSGQFGTTPDLSGEALSITTLARSL